MNTSTTTNDLLDFSKLAEMKQELGSSFSTVLQHFQAGLLARPTRISQAFRANDPELMAMESHSLKSVCKQIGLHQMSQLAADLETMGRSGQLHEAAPLIEQLLSISVSAHQALTRYGATQSKPAPFFGDTNASSL